LTLKQLRVLESKFAEYNREHVQSILDDFSAGVNAKLDRFLREKQAEAEYVFEAANRTRVIYQCAGTIRRTELRESSMS
jgi:5'-deoxynucleotidase YfbR-like HD superfamily hydrolase